MPIADLPLEISRVLVALGLSVFVGVPLARFFGWMTRGDGEKEEKRQEKDFLEGEERTGSAAAAGGAGGDRVGDPRGDPGGERAGDPGGEAPSLGRARFTAAGALLVGVLLEVQVLGSSLPPRHVWRAVTIFVLLASLVYSVMVVAPKARYYDERALTFEENLRAPWHARRDAARVRASRIDLVGFLLALAALVLG